MHSLLAALLLSAASASTAAASTEDARFEAMVARYVQGLLDRSPETATRLGDHSRDGRLDDASRAGVQKDLAANQAALRELAGIDAKKLSPEDGVDARILRNALESQIFALETLREWEWNPLRYNPGQALYNLVARDFAPPEGRLRSAIGRLDGVPALVAAAKANLKAPPRIHTETAIAQNKGTVALVEKQLEPLVRQAPALEKDFRAAQGRALAALRDLQQFLEKDLLPRSTGDFRIGEAKYRRKLRFALDSDLSKEEILSRAEKDLARTHAAMEQTARALWPQLFPGRAPPDDRRVLVQAVLDERAKKHPDNATVIGQAARDLAAITAFVKTRGLVTVPEEPLEVTPWPEFSRGVAVASCNPPGILEKNGKTFFYISPTPADWTAQRVESFFREYNDDMLQDLTIHEAMPGHYLQLAHANRFQPPTLIRAIARSGTFTEGWATYAEQVMADAGYGGPAVRLQQLKMRLRLILNAVIDQKVHAGAMTEREAIELMMKEGYQEEGEAAGKWKRAQLTSTQLSTYYVGNAEMNDLRAAWEKKNPGKNLRELHDKMLSFGAAAPRYVRERMGL
ncbi:MAG: DUF885 domain-containing protein [Myxococcales bacterium]